MGDVGIQLGLTFASAKSDTCIQVMEDSVLTVTNAKTMFVDNMGDVLILKVRIDLSERGARDTVTIYAK